jgi:hypothetical protein
MYSQLGIRSTRHQTFKLDETNIEKIIPAHRIKYQNLPLWSRRNGTVIYIYRNDNFFDTLVRNKLREKQEERAMIIRRENRERRRKEWGSSTEFNLVMQEHLRSKNQFKKRSLWDKIKNWFRR